ncbi:uncharacterized protein LOC111331104 isoform X2 [Stylophora pistillata]|uniref:uncharacterized protein LOC111331104 isoform X2 n=1 Tax=Stylophora pistillata TaxID=50429 RepID=UPI000C056F14|nr:uncharacterized protein LOC111331104 isoform X2 [Stylophora pistillata]
MVVRIEQWLSKMARLSVRWLLLLSQPAFSPPCMQQDFNLVLNVDCEGYNRVFVDSDPSAHGEVVAIRNAGKNLGMFEITGCSLYTNFEPCPMCAATIWWSKLDRVFYAQPVKGSTVHHEENQEEVFNFVATPIDKRSIPGEQIESKAKEALDIIEKYLTDHTKKV